MKKTLAKTVVSLAAAVLLLGSLGASAELAQCKKGEKWDAASKSCVAKK